MNSELPLTRRDFVSLFIYILIGADVFLNLIQVVSFKILSCFPIFISNISTSYPILNLLHLVQLLLLPLVPLIASGVAGRYGNQVVAKRYIRSLILPCTGLAMCGISFPSIISAAYFTISYRLFNTSGTSFAYPLIFIANYLVVFSVGFALAFFPSIFDSLRSRIQDEESA